MPLAAFDLLASVVAAGTARFGRLDRLAEEAKVPLPQAMESLWRLSAITTDGAASLPSASRTAMTSTATIWSHRPLSRQA
jgi:hypothetical protein